MKKTWMILFVIIAAIIIYLYFNPTQNKQSASDSVKESTTKENTRSDARLGASSDPALPRINPDDEIVRHKYYTLCYDEKHEQAAWVAYKLTDEMASGNMDRKEKFRKDEMVSSGSAEPDDYRRSGYDKGHLCPAADMSFSEEAMSESFYMSNMSPQLHAFNNGIWKELEEKVRSWAIKDKSIYIVTGPVIKTPYETIGKDRVAVPQYYYKVVLDYHEPGIKGIGFIFRNKSTKLDLEDFAVSIDSVESFTGIDFFDALPDEVEKTVERSFNYSKW
jgi:endonuclease G, mitochondrial